MLSGWGHPSIFISIDKICMSRITLRIGKYLFSSPDSILAPIPPISTMVFLSSALQTPSVVQVHSSSFRSLIPLSTCSSLGLGHNKQRQKKTTVVAMGNAGNGVLEKAVIAGGLVSTPVIAWSLYTLKTTGCGLPPGPGGSIGALEGVSYLVVVGIVVWSFYTKSKTGSGLPNGPFGLLGAVEGLSYLSLLAILLVFGFQFLDKGSLPGPLPGDDCLG